jgi:outer membrane protein assembly factor BamB
VLVGGRLDLVAGSDSSGCVLVRVDPATGNVLTSQTFGQPSAGPTDLCILQTPLGTDTDVATWTQVILNNSAACAPTHTELVYNGITSLSHFQQELMEGPFCYIGNPPLPPVRFGPPMQAGNLIVVPTGDNIDSLQTFRADTGQLGWSTYAGGTVNGPVVALPNGDLANTTQAGDLVVRNGATGQFKWSAHLDTTLTLPPAASQTTIFVATPSGALDALPVGGCNATTCSPVWHATLASPASARPSIGGNVVYVGSNDGSVTAFAAGGCNASTCSSLWSGSTGSKITGAPAIGQGAVVVGSDDGTVTAFRLQPPT